MKTVQVFCAKAIWAEIELYQQTNSKVICSNNKYKVEWWETPGCRSGSLEEKTLILGTKKQNRYCHILLAGNKLELTLSLLGRGGVKLVYLKIM